MSTKVLSKVLLVSMCLMLIAFVFPQTVLAAHTLSVHDQIGVCEGVYCRISILTSAGWDTVYGYTDENGEFTNDTIEETAEADHWSWEILEPLHLQGPVVWIIPHIGTRLTYLTGINSYKRSVVQIDQPTAYIFKTNYVRRIK